MLDCENCGGDGIAEDTSQCTDRDCCPGGMTCSVCKGEGSFETRGEMMTAEINVNAHEAEALRRSFEQRDLGDIMWEEM